MRASPPSRAPRITVVGDVFVDRDVDGRASRLAPDSAAPVLVPEADTERPGGAGLAAALAALGGAQVTLVAPLRLDPAGRRVQRMLTGLGVRVVALDGAEPTMQKVRLRVDGRTLLRVDRAGPPDAAAPAATATATASAATGPTDPPLPRAAVDALDSADAVLVACYGNGATARPAIRAHLAERAGRTRLLWDPHPHGGPPVPGCILVTPNAAEARSLAGEAGPGLAPDASAGLALLRAWHADAVAVTLGDRGALLVRDGDGAPLLVPASRQRGDACGAGDALAAAAARALAAGALVSEAVQAGVLSAEQYVRAGGPAGLRRALAGGDATAAPATGPLAAAHAVRARGGTVVAAGGCFDVLHAGHVQLLSQARALGDHLVVLLNSDASVRRLKGAGRPLNGERDRVQVLRALAAVDEVVLFDEDTPERVLAELRPHVFVKGGDYALTGIPEARLLAAWGGQAVVLPYLQGRSSTSIMRELAHD